MKTKDKMLALIEELKQTINSSSHDADIAIIIMWKIKELERLSDQLLEEFYNNQKR